MTRRDDAGTDTPAGEGRAGAGAGATDPGLAALAELRRVSLRLGLAHELVQRLAGERDRLVLVALRHRRQADVARALGVSRGMVSRIVARARERADNGGGDDL